MLVPRVLAVLLVVGCGARSELSLASPRDVGPRDSGPRPIEGDAASPPSCALEWSDPVEVFAGSCGAYDRPRLSFFERDEHEVMLFSAAQQGFCGFRTGLTVSAKELSPDGAITDLDRPVVLHEMQDGIAVGAGSVVATASAFGALILRQGPAYAPFFELYTGSVLFDLAANDTEVLMVGREGAEQVSVWRVPTEGGSVDGPRVAFRPALEGAGATPFQEGFAWAGLGPSGGGDVLVWRGDTVERAPFADGGYGRFPVIAEYRGMLAIAARYTDGVHVSIVDWTSRTEVARSAVIEAAPNDIKMLALAAGSSWLFLATLEHDATNGVLHVWVLDPSLSVRAEHTWPTSRADLEGAGGLDIQTRGDRAIVHWAEIIDPRAGVGRTMAMTLTCE